jgi:phosphoglycerate dehydrogenase-like enzyme
MSIDPMLNKDSPKFHLHVENNRYQGEVFDISRPKVYAALALRGNLADRVNVTIGYDGDIFGNEIRTAHALVGWKFDRQCLAGSAPNLRWIHVTGAGVESFMPLDWLPKGVVFTNNSGVHGERASEYAIMAILALNNRLPEMFTNQVQARWEKAFNTGVAGKTLLIVGVGSIGSATARHAKHFSMCVIGVRRSGKPRANVDEMYRPEDLAQVLPRADFVLVTAPETEASRGLIGRKELGLMKPGAGIVVYSRAGLVDYDALREKLERKELSAVLDVFETEPLPPSSPLWKTPNLIVTPHCSSDDAAQYVPRTLDLVFRNIERHLSGKPLVNRVNANRQY